MVLRKTCFQRGFEFFKNISFIKKKVEALKIKSSTENYDMRKLHFGTFHFDISIVEMKNEIRTLFKSPVSRRARIWRLKKTSV